MSSPFRVASALFLLATVSAHAQSVWVVDATGSGDFTWLFQAVDAASAGDSILVRSSMVDTLPFATVVDGKALTIIGDDSSTVPVLVGPMSVRNQPAGTTTLLRHLDTRYTALVNGPLPALAVVNCAGSVWCQDLAGTGGDATLFSTDPGGAGLLVSQSLSIVVADCSFQGGDGQSADALSPVAAGGGPGMLATGSHVSASLSEFRGGGGGQGLSAGTGKGGGDGIAASASTVLLSGCLLLGGGSISACATCAADGLHADAASVVPWLSSTFTGGFNFPFAPGSPIDAPPGVATDLADAPRLVWATAPLREGETGLLSYGGESGDDFGVFAAVDTSWQLLPGKKGVYGLGPAPLGPLLFGHVTDPEGVFELPFTAPQLPGSLEGLTVLLQAFAVESGGGVRLTAPTALVLLDSGF